MLGDGTSGVSECEKLIETDGVVTNQRGSGVENYITIPICLSPALRTDRNKLILGNLMSQTVCSSRLEHIHATIAK